MEFPKARGPRLGVLVQSSWSRVRVYGLGMYGEEMGRRGFGGTNWDKRRSEKFPVSFLGGCGSVETYPSRKNNR